jgi:hypothetical protein
VLSGARTEHHPGVGPIRSSMRSKSLVFLAPSMTFACHQVGLRGLSHRRCLGLGRVTWRCLSQLGSPSELSLRAGFPLLSWDSSACAPPPTYTPGVHSRSPRAPSAGPYQGPDHVPPPRFLSALTACSTWVLRACCIPLPAMRFVAFPPRRAIPPGGGLHPARLPRDATSPFEVSPRQQPYRVTAASCPPAVAPHSTCRPRATERRSLSSSQGRGGHRGVRLT